MGDGIYNLLLIVGVIVSALFTLLILVTSKGDAMSAGGSGIRTTYKGKATIDDQIGRVTIAIACIYVCLMIVLDIANHQRSRGSGIIAPPAQSQPAPAPKK